MFGCWSFEVIPCNEVTTCRTTCGVNVPTVASALGPQSSSPWASWVSTPVSFPAWLTAQLLIACEWAWRSGRSSGRCVQVMSCSHSKGTVTLQSSSLARQRSHLFPRNISHIQCIVSYRKKTKKTKQSKLFQEVMSYPNRNDMRNRPLLIWFMSGDSGSKHRTCTLSTALTGLIFLFESVLWTCGENRATDGTARGYSKGAEQSRTCASSLGWQLKEKPLTTSLSTGLPSVRSAQNRAANTLKIKVLERSRCASNVWSTTLTIT